jgi:hypothetical protein
MEVLYDITSADSDAVNPGSNPGPPATHVIDIARCYNFQFGSEFVRHVRRLLTLHHNGRLPETQNRDPRRTKALGVSPALFRPVRCRALWRDWRGVRQAQIRRAAAAPANRAAGSWKA